MESNGVSQSHEAARRISNYYFWWEGVWRKLVWLAKDIEHTMELQTSKLGSERRGRSIGSAGSRIDTDKSSGLPKPSKQDEGTQATSSLQQDLLKVKPVAIDSAVDCLTKGLGGVRLHPHGGLISRCGAEILPKFFLGRRLLSARRCPVPLRHVVR